MATITGTLKTFDQKGKKPSVEEFINMISPTKTPMYSAIKQTTAKATNHQVQTDELDDVGTNALVQGAAIGTGKELTTTMLDHQTQIFGKVVTVSRTASKVGTYGRGRELNYQVASRGKEIKRDIEASFVKLDQTATAGNNTTAAKLASAQNLIHTDTTVTSGSAVNFTEAKLDEVLEKCYNEGGEPNMLMVTPKHAMRLADFAAASGRTRDFGTGQKLVKAVNLYVSPLGEVSVVVNRFLQNTTVLALDTDYWEKAVLDPMQVKDVPLAIDGEGKFLVTELTLVNRSPKASGKIINLNAA